MEYRDGIKSKETNQGWLYAGDAITHQMRTTLSHHFLVYRPPHNKPYIDASLSHSELGKSKGKRRLVLQHKTRTVADL